jgi:hypothetical protein
LGWDCKGRRKMRRGKTEKSRRREEEESIV